MREQGRYKCPSLGLWNVKRQWNCLLNLPHGWVLFTLCRFSFVLTVGSEEEEEEPLSWFSISISVISRWDILGCQSAMKLEQAIQFYGMLQNRLPASAGYSEPCLLKAALRDYVLVTLGDAATQQQRSCGALDWSNFYPFCFDFPRNPFCCGCILGDK